MYPVHPSLFLRLQDYRTQIFFPKYMWNQKITGKYCLNILKHFWSQILRGRPKYRIQTALSFVIIWLKN